MKTTPCSFALSLAMISCCTGLSLAAPQEAKTSKDKKSKKPEDRATIEKTIRSLEHQIRVGKLQGQLDGKKENSKLAAASLAVEKAVRTHQAAAGALGNFKDHTAPVAVEQAKIRLKSARNSATHAADEFKELVAMYRADEFAEMTKELVLKRSRSRMALATRRVEVQQKELANLQSFTHKAKLLELLGKLADADAARVAATQATQQAALEIKIAGMKAEFKASELVRDLAAAKKKVKS